MSESRYLQLLKGKDPEAYERQKKREYCEDCKHFIAVEITDGLWGDECDLWLEPEWDDEEECFDCEGWRPCPWPD